MALEKAFIPYRLYWSTPFCRWQGSLGRAHALELGARTAKAFFASRNVAPEVLDGIVLGYSVPQRHAFYGAPWVAGMIGAQGITGPTVSQACATSARMIASAAVDVEVGVRDCVLAIACDRTSNGPHIYYPDPQGTGGMGQAENPVWDNFNNDPGAGLAMIETAENVAKEAGITREEQDEITLVRHAQYQRALADDSAFHRRFMVPATIPKSKKETLAVVRDEGAHDTTREGLAKLRPVLDGGSVTFGTQTFPADGNAGIVVCSQAQARKLSVDPNPTIQLLSFAEARVKKGFMPMASVPAARKALERAGISITDCKAIKTHNPFAVNDVYFGRELGLKAEDVNRYGSPLVWGHPQGPTGARAIIELIEELVMAGGGYGLFSGCAAGDSAMSVVLRVR